MIQSVFPMNRPDYSFPTFGEEQMSMQKDIKIRKRVIPDIFHSVRTFGSMEYAQKRKEAKFNVKIVRINRGSSSEQSKLKHTYAEKQRIVQM